MKREERKNRQVIWIGNERNTWWDRNKFFFVLKFLGELSSNIGEIFGKWKKTELNVWEWRKWREQLAAEYCGTATVIQQSIPFIFNHFHFLWYINIYFHFHLPLVMKCNLLWHINCDPTINRISIIHCLLRTIQGSIWDKNANKLLKNTSHKLHTKHCR